MAATLIRSGQTDSANGWVPANETWTYSSVDAPTGIITVPTGAASKYNVGDRIKLTQTTVKYFIVTVITDTTLTLYGGTDYTLANAAITLNYYSHAKSPVGFPMDPAKWSVTVQNTSISTQASPTAGVWYNTGTLTIAIPIGVWNVRYRGPLGGYDGGTLTQLILKATLSTANNSQSSAAWTTYTRVQGASAAAMQLETNVFASGLISITTKATYYLNTLTVQSGVDVLGFNVGEQGVGVEIVAVSAYL